MTVHSSSQWKWTDSIDEFPYEEVVSAVEANREPASTSKGRRARFQMRTSSIEPSHSSRPAAPFHPIFQLLRGAYGVFCTIDAFILNTGVLLERNSTTRQDVEEAIPLDLWPSSAHRDKAVNIIVKLLGMLETSKEKDGV